MSDFGIPADRIHLRAAGDLKQDSTGVLALVLVEALDFLAQPETFPVFLAFVRNDIRVTAYPGALAALESLSPAVLGGLQDFIAAGAAADAYGVPQ